MGQNFEVADLGKKAPPLDGDLSRAQYEPKVAQAEKPAAADGTQKEAPVELSPLGKKVVEALDAVNKAKDKPQALKDNTKLFEDSIKAADDNFDKVSKDAVDAFKKPGADGKSLEDKFKDAQGEVDGHTQKAQEAFQKLKPEDQTKVQGLVEDLQDPDKAAAAMKTLNDKYPDIGKPISEAEASLKKNQPVFEQVEKLEKSMGEAVQDSAITRQAYMGALKAGGGDNAKLQALQMEVLVLMMGGTPSDLKKDDGK